MILFSLNIKCIVPIHCILTNTSVDVMSLIKRIKILYK